MEGAIITHNHPGSGAGSFGKDDFEFLRQNQSVSELRAVDEDYTYSVRIVKSIENVSYSHLYNEALKYIDLDALDIKDACFRALQSEGYVIYDKKRIK